MYTIEYSRNGQWVNAVTAFSCKGSYNNYSEAYDTIIELTYNNPSFAYRLVQIHRIMYNGQII